MRIVGIFAHPDDAELWCGGSLNLHAKRGDCVDVLLFHCLSEERMREAERGAAILGVNVSFHPAAEYRVPPLSSTIDVLQADPPDVVLTHWAEDTHLEHRQVFEHALESVHHLKRHRKRVPLLLMTSSYFASGARTTFEPNIICDISSVFDVKRAAIAAHESQKPEILMEDVAAQNRLWGLRISAPYAEAFLEYPLFGKHFAARRASFHDLLRPM